MEKFKVSNQQFKSAAKFTFKFQHKNNNKLQPTHWFIYADQVVSFTRAKF